MKKKNEPKQQATMVVKKTQIRYRIFAGAACIISCVEELIVVRMGAAIVIIVAR
jgi:hypothetical protein